MNRKFVTIPFILLLLTLLVTACGNVEIDNSSDRSVNVKIGEDAYTLAPGSRQKVKVSAGDQRLVISNSKGEVQSDTTIRIKEGGVINAGKGNYVIWRDLYGLQANRETLLNEEWIELDSVEYFGDFKLIDSSHVYVESNWSYGLEQNFPNSQKLMIFKDFAIESKVFRQSDFVSEYNRRAGTDG